MKLSIVIFLLALYSTNGFYMPKTFGDSLTYLFGAKINYGISARIAKRKVSSQLIEKPKFTPPPPKKPVTPNAAQTKPDISQIDLKAKVLAAKASWETQKENLSKLTTHLIKSTDFKRTNAAILRQQLTNLEQALSRQLDSEAQRLSYLEDVKDSFARALSFSNSLLLSEQKALNDLDSIREKVSDAQVLAILDVSLGKKKGLVEMEQGMCSSMSEYMSELEQEAVDTKQQMAVLKNSLRALSSSRSDTEKIFSYASNELEELQRLVSKNIKIGASRELKIQRFSAELEKMRKKHQAFLALSEKSNHDSRALNAKGRDQAVQRLTKNLAREKKLREEYSRSVSSLETQVASALQSYKEVEAAVVRETESLSGEVMEHASIHQDRCDQLDTLKSDVGTVLLERRTKVENDATLLTQLVSVKDLIAEVELVQQIEEVVREKKKLIELEKASCKGLQDCVDELAKEVELARKQLLVFRAASPQRGQSSSAKASEELLNLVSFIRSSQFNPKLMKLLEKDISPVVDFPASDRVGLELGVAASVLAVGLSFMQTKTGVRLPQYALSAIEKIVHLDPQSAIAQEGEKVMKSMEGRIDTKTQFEESVKATQKMVPTQKIQEVANEVLPTDGKRVEAGKKSYGLAARVKKPGKF